MNSIRASLILGYLERRTVIANQLIHATYKIMPKTADTQKSWEPDYDSDAAKLETDRNLEKKVLNALQANAFINCEKIRVRVTGRIVFLEGTVHLQKERISAQKCIRDIFGIRAVINYLTYHTQYAK